MTLVLWTLNRVASWNLLDLQEALTGGGWFKDGHQVSLGRREPVDALPDGVCPSRPGVLSHEDGKLPPDYPELSDEYFVPIAVKCLGDPVAFRQRFAAEMTAPGLQLLDTIVAAYPEHFAAAPGATPAFQGYWKVNTGVGMVTRPYVGFYEAIASDSAMQDGARAVLVGYSQGGLVARYLAFLDEYLFKEEARRIAGVITVQAPNRGSPLANRANADHVSAGLLAVLLGFVGLSIPPTGENRALGAAVEDLVKGKLVDNTRHFDVGALCALLDAAIGDALRATSGRKSDSNPAARLDLLQTLRKWVTGLVPLPYITAFADLSTSTFGTKGAVLEALLTHPLMRTYHGAVVGTDSQLDDFVGAGLNGFQRGVLNLFRWMGRLPPTLRAAQEAYRRGPMDEAPVLQRLVAAGQTVAPEALKLADEYVTGMPAGRTTIPPYAHDFVIPSVSQVLPEGPEPFFLGNVVNPKGSHISGGSSRNRDSDVARVKAMLKDMAKRLAAKPGLPPAKVVPLQPKADPAAATNVGTGT